MARSAWLDSDFEIPAEVTAGKSEIQIKLAAHNGSRWDEFTYWVFSYVKDPEREAAEAAAERERQGPVRRRRPQNPT
jgi:hypothetical protein